MTDDSFACKTQLEHEGKSYHYASLPLAESNGLDGISRLPFCLKVLLENLLRHEDGHDVTRTDIEAFSAWLEDKHSDHGIVFHPARILMQDFTGVPAVVDLAALRQQAVVMGGKAKQITPCIPADLVIDHSIQVDQFGTESAADHNVAMEIERNQERYAFLKWAQDAFDGLNVVPPGMGICHQVNLEYLGKCVWAKECGDQTWLYPDTLVGTDSHSTMINSLGILGWGVGGIEAEACMLNQPISMVIPDVIGVRLKGRLRDGIYATDLVLTITQMLREYGVVGKFVEFFGEGARSLSLADRATVSNMVPEFGATAGVFAIDDETLKYLCASNRSPEHVAIVKAYLQEQGMWVDEAAQEADYTDVLELDLGQVGLSVAGPNRPQDRVDIADLPGVLANLIPKITHREASDDYQIGDVSHGDVVIAAITSCTNTSNPFVMIAAGLVAKKAVEKGIAPKPWVKTSLAPGSKVVTDYLKSAGLLPYLEQIGFHLVGYGCTTCIGNSGPLPEAVSNAITAKELKVSAVLSGNRNFEGRIHQQVKLSWLASPPLVVAFALAGTTNIRLDQDIIATSASGESVTLKDLWPTNEEIMQCLGLINKEMFAREYANLLQGEAAWQALPVDTSGDTYEWDAQSTYVKNPPFLKDMAMEPGALPEIENARILALFGDSVTTDHISPAGAIAKDSPAGRYLQEKGVAVEDFNSYGSRRGNHEVMMRGTFANIRIRNRMTPEYEGGWTKHAESSEVQSIYDVAMQYQKESVPLVVIAGKEYGTGSSRDWAAKGTALLGVKAVIAQSYERIHRSNLIGMGVLPLQFMEGESADSFQIDGTEILSIEPLQDDFNPKQALGVSLAKPSGENHVFRVLVRIDTEREFDYYRHGGILPYALRSMLEE